MQVYMHLLEIFDGNYLTSQKNIHHYRQTDFLNLPMKKWLVGRTVKTNTRKCRLKEPNQTNTINYCT